MSLFDRLRRTFRDVPTFRAAARLELEGHPVGLVVLPRAARALHSRLVVLTGEGALVGVEVSGDSRDAGNTATRVAWKRDLALGANGGALALATAAPSRDEARRVLVVTGMDGRVRVFGAEGVPLADVALEGRGWVEHVAAHFEGEALVVHATRGKVLFTLRFATLAEAPEVVASPAHASTLAALSVHAEGVAVARFGGADVWPTQAPRGEGPRSLEWPSSLVSIAWSPDGRYLAAGCQDQALHFWRWPSGDDSMMGGYLTKPRHLVWTPGGEALLTASGADVVVWDFRGEGPEGTAPLQLRGTTEGSITALALGPVGDGDDALEGTLVVSGSRDGWVRVYPLRLGQEGEVRAFWEGALGGAAPEDHAPIEAAATRGADAIEHVAFVDASTLVAATSSGALHTIRRA